MTEHQAAGGPSSGKGSWAWVWWPASLVAFALALLAGHNDAVEAKLERQFGIVVWLLGLFYTVAAVVFMSRLARRALRRWATIRQKARDHDGLDAELQRWKVSAAKATARAEDAESRVAMWDRDTMEEGRRRLLSEVRALYTSTTFSAMDCAEDGDLLLLGARWAGEQPLIDSRYVLRSRTLKDVKATLELQAIREDGIVVFRVHSVKSPTFRASLTSQAHSSRTFPDDVEIVPRDELDFGKEAIWPEN